MNARKSKNTRKKNYVNKRPIQSAKNFKPGKQYIGRDDETLWIVAIKSNGAHYWKRCVSKKTRNTRKQNTRKPKTQKQRIHKKSYKQPKTKKTNSQIDRKRYLDSIRGSVSDYMEGHTIVLTGKMWDNKKNIEECLTEHGAVISSKITYQTSSLIVGKQNHKSLSLKIIEANDKNVDIIYSDELYDALYN